MKYKAIALDLDGTLTVKGKGILPATKQILIDLAKQGVKIILASGRPTPGMYQEACDLEMDKIGGYVLSYNGANVIDFKTKELFYNKTIEASQVHEIYDHAKKYDLAVMTYDNTNIITEDDQDQYVIGEGKVTTMPVLKVASFKEKIDFPVNKVLLTKTPEEAAIIVDKFKAPYGDQLSIYRSSPYFIEVMANGIDKAASLKILLEKLNIDASELIAFGDGYNDLSMIEYAGLGVAMGNSVEGVLQRANHVTLSNLEDGIYHCLKDLIAKGEL